MENVESVGSSPLLPSSLQFLPAAYKPLAGSLRASLALNGFQEHCGLDRMSPHWVPVVVNVVPAKRPGRLAARREDTFFSDGKMAKFSAFASTFFCRRRSQASHRDKLFPACKRNLRTLFLVRCVRVLNSCGTGIGVVGGFGCSKLTFEPPFEPGFVSRSFIFLLSMLAFWTLSQHPPENSGSYGNGGSIMESRAATKKSFASSRQRKVASLNLCSVASACGTHAARAHMLPTMIADGLIVHIQPCLASSRSLFLSDSQVVEPFSDLRSTPVLLCCLPKQAHDLVPGHVNVAPMRGLKSDDSDCRFKAQAGAGLTGNHRSVFE